MLVNSWDSTQDFFKITPEAIHIKEFYDLKKNNKLYNKLLWFTAFMCDKKSPYYNMTERRKLTMLADSFLDGNYDKYKDTLDKLSTVWYEVTESTIERFCREWKLDIEEKLAFARSLKYDIEEKDNIKIKSDLVNSYNQDYKNWKVLFEELNKETNKTLGNQQKSRADEGKLLKRPTNVKTK